ncbi:MAG: thiolase family protein [Deltaproteobacteria bacterium]|nr:thiolase family protein [Candidatus Zymogenaceae bacterium]
MAQKTREVVMVDGIRTAFGRAGEKGYFWDTRADDLVTKVIDELLVRNPKVTPDLIEDNIWGATTQWGDQGITMGRTTVLTSNLPVETAGCSIDRMCAGGMSAMTYAAGQIAMGAADIILAGGVEHMGHHPMGDGADPNPRLFQEKIVSVDDINMGKTAENLHDMFPDISKEICDEYALLCQQKAKKALDNGKMAEMMVPMTVYTKEGWMVADYDMQPRPETTMEGLAGLKTPFREGGRVTAGNSSGLNDGASGALLMSLDKAKELGYTPAMKVIGWAFAGVPPRIMGYGPIPATHRALEKYKMKFDDFGLIELNEAFAVQAIAFMNEFGMKVPDDPRLNIYGGAIAFGHPLATSGIRLMIHLMHAFRERPDVKYGMTTMCVGLGQGGTVLWENLLAK